MPLSEYKTAARSVFQAAVESQLVKLPWHHRSQPANVSRLDLRQIRISPSSTKSNRTRGFQHPADFDISQFRLGTHLARQPAEADRPVILLSSNTSELNSNMSRPFRARVVQIRIDFRNNEAMISGLGRADPRRRLKATRD